MDSVLRLSSLRGSKIWWRKEEEVESPTICSVRLWKEMTKPDQKRKGHLWQRGIFLKALCTWVPFSVTSVYLRKLIYAHIACLQKAQRKKGHLQDLPEKDRFNEKRQFNREEIRNKLTEYFVFPFTTQRDGGLKGKSDQSQKTKLHSL